MLAIGGKYTYKSYSRELELLHVAIWERKEPVKFCPLDSEPVGFADSSQVSQIVLYHKSYITCS